jgi:hypothetical protein
VKIARSLNDVLPKEFFAEPLADFGIAIDVAALEESAATDFGVHVWTPPPTQTVDVSLRTDTVEVRIFQDLGGPHLVGAIELVSPANKDRLEHREALVGKCVALLHQGIGLMIVDVVTERRANLHQELLRKLGESNGSPWNVPLYATAYHPAKREEQTHVDIWKEELQIGQALPTLPLWLRGGLCFAIDLEATYEQACQELRIPAPPAS